MTVRFELRSEAEEILKARAAAAGMSVDQYAKGLLERELGAETPQEMSREHPGATPIPGSLLDVTNMILERFRNLPGEPFDPPRPDGASQHDHYIYGTPKRDDL